MQITQNTRFIFCTECGHLIRTEKFGDVLTLKDLRRLKRITKNYCLTCKLKNRQVK